MSGFDEFNVLLEEVRARDPRVITMELYALRRIAHAVKANNQAELKIALAAWESLTL